MRPIKYGEDNETFVCFVGNEAFRDFRAWLIANNSLKDAMERGAKNPLFSGGTSYEWDGVLVRQIPEIASFNNTAVTPVAVAPYFFCGSQALGVAWAKTYTTTMRKEDDYQLRKGIGFMELRGVEKLMYGTGSSGVDWGMLTGYTSAVASA